MGGFYPIGVAKGSITLPSLSSTIISRVPGNLITNWTVGNKLVNGVVTSDINYSLTDYITIQPSLPYIIYNTSGMSFDSYAVYDTNHIVTAFGIITDGVVNGFLGKKIITGVNDVYVRISSTNTWAVTAILAQTYDQGLDHISNYTSANYNFTNALLPYKKAYSFTNLFDKNLYSTGYILNSDGGVSANVSHGVSPYIPVVGGNTYTLQIHPVNMPRLCTYDANGTLLGYYTTSGTAFGTITFGPTVAYIRFAIQPMYLNSGVKLYSGQYRNNLIVVSQSGNGDFTTIGDAVNYAQDGDTILVMPGSYNEVVDCGIKYLSIIGQDKTNCILWNNTGVYATPPLSQMYGYIKNMTIKALRSVADLASGRTTDIPYCVHNDYFNGVTPYKTDMTIEDCNLYSEWSSCLGSGVPVYDKAVLTVKKCRMETAITTIGAFLHHNQTASNITAKVILDNNRFISGNSAWALNWGVAGASAVTIEAYNNISYSVLTGTACVIKDASANTYYTASPINFGNNIPVI